MPVIFPCELPASALLQKYTEGGGYADCYFTEIRSAVSQPEFVEAFYTTALFKLERALLGLLAGRPSTDLQAGELAAGRAARFAAWQVEGRSADQLLLADFTGKTRSWLMVASAGGSTASPKTRLYFGSAIVPRRSTGPGKPKLGIAFRALLGFHKLYSRLLLRAAAARLLAKR